MQETLEKTRAMVHHLAAVNEILEKNAPSGRAAREVHLLLGPRFFSDLYAVPLGYVNQSLQGQVASASARAWWWFSRWGSIRREAQRVS